MRLTLPAALIACAFALVACGRDGDRDRVPSPFLASPPAATLPVERASGADLAAAATQPAWLRERLPAATIAYLRVPAGWAPFSTPDGREQDVMLSNAGHAEAMAELRRALRLDPLFDRLSNGMLTLLLGQTTPLEAVLLGQGGSVGLDNRLLFTVGLDVVDRAALARQLGTLLDIAPPVFSASGHTQIDLNGLPLVVRHDADAGRLWLLDGQASTPALLDGLVAEIADASPATADSPIGRARALENQIDASGHGFVAWLSTPAVAPLLNMFAARQAPLLLPLIADSQTLAIGLGSAGQRGHLALRVQFARSPWTDLMPAGPFVFDFGSVGTPAWVTTLALPSVEELRALLDSLASDTAAQLDRDLITHSGLDLAAWLAPFGREALALRDDAGQYYAVRISDAAALDRVTSALASFATTPPRSHVHHGHTLHHLVLPNFVADAALGTANPSPLASLLGRLSSHVYWYVDGDWLVIARLPQPLMARIDSGAMARHPVDGWLRATQGSTRRHALLSASMQIDDLAQRIWHTRLELLQALADSTATPIDMFRLPTAAQLTLPHDAGYGVELVIDGSQLALDVNFEHTPIDPLLAGNPMLATAAIGIVAAVALPAYQDYTQRAHVTRALAETIDARMALARLYGEYRQLPDDPRMLAIFGLNLPRPLRATPGTLSYHGGALRLEFSDFKRNGPQVLWLMPELDGNGILQWSCGPAIARSPRTPLATLPAGESFSTLPDSIVPAQCHGPGGH